MRSAVTARARPSCTAQILERADARVVVEFEPQSRIEGEIQQMPADFPVTEFTQRSQRRVARARARAARGHDLRFGRFRARGLFLAALPAAPAPARSAAGSSRSIWCRIWRIRRTCSAAAGARAQAAVARVPGDRHERRARGGAASGRPPTSARPIAAPPWDRRRCGSRAWRRRCGRETCRCATSAT